LEARARRRARAYRNFIIKNVWPMHMQGLVLSIVACSVSVVKQRLSLTFPFLTGEDAVSVGENVSGAERVLFAVGRLLDPRWISLVILPAMLACALYAPRWYAARFEFMCDLVNVLGLLVRHTVNIRVADYVLDGQNLVLYDSAVFFVRPALLVCAAISFRYEFSKQWRANALRISLDIPLAMYRKRRSVPLEAERRMLDSFLSELPQYFAVVFAMCLVHSVFERRDRKTFNLHMRRVVMNANAANIVADGIYSEIIRRQ